MKKLSVKLAILAAGILLSLNVLAVSLDQAKSQGLVGEQANGYLGVVKSGGGVDNLLLTLMRSVRPNIKLWLKIIK